MTLYEIDQEIFRLQDPETGEIYDDCLERLVQLNMERDKKLENIAVWVKNLKVDAAALAAEIKVLSERKKAVEKKQERLRGMLEAALDGQRFTTPRCDVSFRKNPPSIIIEDENGLMEWASKYGMDDIFIFKKPEPSKEALKAKLEDGFEIPGVSLVQKIRMEVK